MEKKEVKSKKKVAKSTKATKPKEENKVETKKKKATPKKNDEKIVAKEKKTIKKEKIVVKEEQKKKTIKKERDIIVKEEKQEELLEKKDQKIIKVLSKILSIVFKIGKICLMIVLPFIFLAMIAIPFLFKKLEINGNVIRLDDMSVVINEKYVTFKIGDKEYISDEDKQDLSYVTDFIANNSIEKMVLFLEISFGFAAVSITILIYILMYLEKIFKNINIKDSPFILENEKYLFNIVNLMIVSSILALVYSIVMVILFPDNKIINIKCYGLIELAVVYAIYYIYKYAVKLQDKSDYKMYS